METSNSPCAFFSGSKTQKGPRTHLNSSFSRSSTVRREYTISGRAVLNAAKLSLAQENSSPPLLLTNGYLSSLSPGLWHLFPFSSSGTSKYACVSGFTRATLVVAFIHFFFFFKKTGSPYCVVLAVLAQRSPTLTSQMLGLKLCAMTPWWDPSLQRCLFYVALAVLEQSPLLSIKHKVSSPGWLQMFYVGWPESPASTWVIGLLHGAEDWNRDFVSNPQKHTTKEVFLEPHLSWQVVPKNLAWLN